MIQAISPARPTSPTLPLQPLYASTLGQTQPLKTQTDSLKLSSNRVTEQEARTALEGLEKQYGSFRKPGFFSSPKIDLNEALSRIKAGKDVVATHKVNGHEVRDKFDSFDKLMLLDDLQGRKQDHGVAKPELRLPLLFLEDKKLEAFNSNSDQTEYLSLFGAYDDLRRDWRIVVEGKEVKPKDLASYVVNKGWTAKADPNLSMLNRFRQLPEAGWQVNGQNVGRDIAYLAMLTGTGRIQFSGIDLQTQQDFDLLMNLVANEANGAIDADLRSRLTALKLDQFNSPGITNYFVAYQHLRNGQALSYQGNNLGNLDEVFVFDALMGSKKPATQISADLQNALLYLGQDSGLSARNLYDAWQKLKSGETVVYTFAGGPTGEGFRLTANSHDGILALKQEVVAQRTKDQFRPDLKEAKGIFSDRLPLFDQPLAGNLDKTRQAAERARQDIPLQEARRDQAQRDYDSVKPIRDRAYDEMKRAESQKQSAERSYQLDQRSYDWEKDKYDRIQRDYDRSQRDYERSNASARRLDDLARQEDGLVTSDPKNADAHRQKAASYRSQAQNARNNANHSYNEMQRYRMDLDRQRWDLDRAERQLNQSRRNYWDAKSNFDSKNNEFQRQDSLMRDASSRINQAESQIALAQRTIADADTIEKLTQDAQGALNSLKKILPGLKTYAEFAQVRNQLQSQAQLLRQVFSNSTYTGVHGKALLNQFQPLLTLLNNMDKPAAQK
ncbi:hypothetical protein COW36_18905 [bacterium (Candidatus Blackallbacteria) CG17_big_fil_post_rev_8_21_14_2_50_48_46]|uniref:Uncharacterized protein n=1 Tax=bacterium (Candidatus Blackallbacteria) CG17_big_fil_post_rev_8_21_14_2_50_48_46 TaxID=2014261 RepID=A0A2M7G047_9BACT|nr:MAG: hypothetical protein COW64_25565 [bacterium (Candidatus Blackallbacteria) CG18_big_fil_WC_8_21_14_2_50_49_26]PIW14997.1 MAG: hypothetical protein COW36_18905 [bacterium (Candidatus Blackallbacteria) CG17_big_fil_post_rev_8_21_14_2_50_48_46]PIW50078.1 MAG: hypothetical protein COW20_03840 [bacterium (Candidatus Blackallbacteria) CG13_big_fil_rev_8_21_14_2_50_49_14]